MICLLELNYDQRLFHHFGCGRHVVSILLSYDQHKVLNIKESDQLGPQKCNVILIHASAGAHISFVVSN